MSRKELLSVTVPYETNCGTAASFGFKTPKIEKPVFIDFPNFNHQSMMTELVKNEQLTHPEIAEMIFCSHSHGDHFAGRSMVDFLCPVIGHANTRLIADKVNRRFDHFKNWSDFKVNEPLTIPDFGRVIPFAITHSTIDNFGFLLELESGMRVLYGGDSRLGQRTWESLGFLSDHLGGERIDLALLDFTGFGEIQTEEEEHLAQMREVLREGRKNKLPSVLFLRRGDYGALHFWWERGVFHGCKLYVDQDLVGALEEIDFLRPRVITSDKFQAVDLDNDELINSIIAEAKASDDYPIFIYDDRKKYPLESKSDEINVDVSDSSSKYQLIATGPLKVKPNHHHNLNYTALHYVGQSGHDQLSTELLIDIYKPKKIVPIHSPKNPENNALLTYDELLESPGETILFK